MSQFKFGFTSHSDKDNEEEKGRAETKQKYKKEKQKRCFLPKWKEMACDSMLNHRGSAHDKTQ